MHHLSIPLRPDAPGSTLTLDVFSYGPEEPQGRCVYVQAGLHANEVPGMLVLLHLRERLAALEEAGRLRGNVVVVPCANPIGLRQISLGLHHGRFDVASGQNFNRNFCAFQHEVLNRLASAADLDEAALARTVKAAIKDALGSLEPATPLEALRVELMKAAANADIVLDLHCDREACLHVYANAHHLDQATGLAAHLGAPLVLHALEQGGASFDDNIVCEWQNVYARLGRAVETVPVFAATVELRGRTDVGHELAAADADHLIAWFIEQRIVERDADRPDFERHVEVFARPLNGVETLRAPIAGVLVYHARIGAWVKKNQLIAEILDPTNGASAKLCSTTDGFFFARDHERYVSAGHSVSYVAGANALKKTALLSV
ncbi:succinylglutamate desuccinylase/aspartoacylase family protein [Paraburkholderia silviterrae]|uniref:Succinylglutamate desuccinylase/Aspartoacylase catalytic domain-containing protein n=1 Tax=Paraburkholderia silviterrae TaxID=2528715 RepID=A0A4R5M1G6_9BURK|nr:succinylglutamate desuccinylase/aspartoacylase family protein [Paraburkholderia silviterrae]TDG19139.1 hypothetical protein EYW47_31940 [Paraburkholderia silviterrae]